MRNRDQNEPGPVIGELREFEAPGIDSRNISFHDLFYFWILASGFQAAVIWFSIFIFGR